MPDLQQRIVNIIDQLQALAQPAMQTAITAVRVGGILDILVGFICAGICYGAIKLCISQLKAANDAVDDADIAHILLSLISGICGIGFLVATAVNLLNTFNWLCAVRPDLALAQMMLHRIL